MTQLQSRSDIKNIQQYSSQHMIPKRQGKAARKTLYITYNIWPVPVQGYTRCKKTTLHIVINRHDIFCSVPVTVQTCHSVLFGTGPTHVGTKRSCHLGSCRLECSSLRNHHRRLTVTCITQPATHHDVSRC